MFKTRITDMFGIEYPVLAGAMQWLSRAEFVSAVSHAGGLAFIVSAIFTHKEELREEIHRTRALTDKPFGVNLVFLPATVPPDYDGYIDVIIEEGIDIVETAGRSPEPYIKRLKDNNIKVIHKCGSVRHAQKAQDIGCDAVTIDGMACAGHPGELDLASVVLVPKAADTLDIPVVAAGGFADGRGLLAALSLGAEGVLMGTRFMVSKETPMHPRVKEHLVKLEETDTTYILRSFQNTARVIKNAVSQKVADLENTGAPIEDVLPLVSGTRGRELLETGDVNAGVLSCGQAIGLIDDIPSVKEIMASIINEAEKTLQGLEQLK